MESRQLHRGRLIDPAGNNIEAVYPGPAKRNARSVLVEFEG
ncbi:hypothetical protein [Sphingomonas sp.]|nr:hypothetical protein [Sphingomonas sp.]